MSCLKFTRVYALQGVHISSIFFNLRASLHITLIFFFALYIFLYLFSILLLCLCCCLVCLFVLRRFLNPYIKIKFIHNNSFSTETENSLKKCYIVTELNHSKQAYISIRKRLFMQHLYRLFSLLAMISR